MVQHTRAKKFCIRNQCRNTFIQSEIQDVLIHVKTVTLFITLTIIKTFQRQFQYTFIVSNEVQGQHDKSTVIRSVTPHVKSNTLSNVERAAPFSLDTGTGHFHHLVFCYTNIRNQQFIIAKVIKKIRVQFRVQHPVFLAK